MARDSGWKLVSWVRVAVILFILLAIVAAVGMVIDLFDYWSLKGRKLDVRVFRLIGWVLVNVLFAAGVLTLGLLYLWVRMARSLPNLQGWHREAPRSEFRSRQEQDDFTLDDYLKQETRLFDELDQLVEKSWAGRNSGEYSRFNPESISWPGHRGDGNWNRSRWMEAESPRGGVLLIHGLSDAPYSLRNFGERLHREGFSVLWLRVPGHGTNPRALAEVSWQDWRGAVRVAARGLRDRLPPHAPLILGGYSNGGGLSVDYALQALEDPELPRPQAIVLVSPMIGINPLAPLSRLYHLVGIVSRVEKATWSSIHAEIDPYKFSSWPMNANVQAWQVTRSVERNLRRLEKAGRLSELPPVLALQSVVDSTVSVPRLIDVLFDRLPTSDSELFLVDVDREDRLGNLINLSFEESVKPKLKANRRAFRLSVLRNVNVDSAQLELATRLDDQWSAESLPLHWPTGIISLSHIAVPIPADDPLYGEEGHSEFGISLGSVTLRAEPSALMIPQSTFVRARYNPFYEYMETRAVDWLNRVLSAGPPGAREEPSGSGD